MPGIANRYGRCLNAMQRNNTENSKQIFPEKQLRGHNPNFHVHVSVSDLSYYIQHCFICRPSDSNVPTDSVIEIPMIYLPTLLQENMKTDPGNI
jgi:hypothetical protein